MNQILPSTILGFLTGRLYSKLPPTEEYTPLVKALTGENPYTHQLPGLRKAYTPPLLVQLPSELLEVVKTWEHSADWRERCAALNEKFGLIEINQVQPAI